MMISVGAVTTEQYSIKHRLSIDIHGFLLCLAFSSQQVG
jgi:hypothetical protein